MPDFPNLTQEQRQHFAALLHEIGRRAALIRARRAALGGCSLAATDAAGLPDRDSVVAASEEPLSEALIVKGE